MDELLEQLSDTCNELEVACSKEEQSIACLEYVIAQLEDENVEKEVEKEEPKLDEKFVDEELNRILQMAKRVMKDENNEDEFSGRGIKDDEEEEKFEELRRSLLLFQSFHSSENILSRIQQSNLRSSFAADGVGTRNESEELKIQSLFEICQLFYHLTMKKNQEEVVNEEEEEMKIINHQTGGSLIQSLFFSLLPSSILIDFLCLMEKVNFERNDHERIEKLVDKRKMNDEEGERDTDGGKEESQLEDELFEVLDRLFISTKKNKRSNSSRDENISKEEEEEKRRLMQQKHELNEIKISQISNYIIQEIFLLEKEDDDHQFETLFQDQNNQEEEKVIEIIFHILQLSESINNVGGGQNMENDKNEEIEIDNSTRRSSYYSLISSDDKLLIHWFVICVLLIKYGIKEEEEENNEIIEMEDDQLNKTRQRQRRIKSWINSFLSNNNSSSFDDQKMDDISEMEKEKEDSSLVFLDDLI